MTRQRAVAYDGGRQGKNSGLPFNEKAGDALRDLRQLLGTWARMCHEEGIPGAPSTLPRDTPAAISRWLLRCLDGLQRHDAGPDAVAEIVAAATAADRVVTWQKQPRIFLGPCAFNGESDCPGEMYAREGEPVGQCEECLRGVTVVIRQGELDADLDGRLLSAAEIADWTVRLDASADRAKVKKRILHWHERRRIGALDHREHGATSVPLFRFGEVRQLLSQAAQR